MTRKHYFPCLFYGLLLFTFGIVFYLFGVMFGFPRYLFGMQWLLVLQEVMVWCSSIPIILSFALALIVFFVLFKIKRSVKPVNTTPLHNWAVMVVPTSYNDEAGIHCWALSDGVNI